MLSKACSCLKGSFYLFIFYKNRVLSPVVGLDWMPLH